MIVSARAASAALWILLLAGCASSPPPPVAGTPAPVVAAEYRLSIDVSQSSLRELLDTHLDLARFRASSVPLGAAELQRLVRATPAEARALLETEGYFNATARVEQTDERPGDLRLVVEPGPLTRVSGLQLDLAAEAPLPEPDQQAVLQMARQAWSLHEGDAFTQAAWSAAKSATLQRLRAGGFPLARWDETRADVDPEAARAQLSLRLQPGVRARLGSLRIEGLERHSESVVQRLAGFQSGDRYLESRLLDFQERLVKTQLFDAARVQLLLDEPGPDGLYPVLVSLREAPQQQATTSVGYHANAGQRVGLEYLNRQPLGLPLRARSKLELGRELRTAEFELSSHPQEDFTRRLASMQYEQDRSGDQISTSLGLRLGWLRDTTDDEQLTYAELLRSREERTGSIDRRAAVSLNRQWIERRLDNVLLPLDGHHGLLLVGAGMARDDGGSAGFARAQFKLGVFRPLGAHWFGSARIEAAQVLGAGQVALPEKLLWRAGGDDSVRGYAFHSLGPQAIVNGSPAVVGGRVMATASVEAARPFNLAMPQLMGAVFIDAGQAATSWGSYRPQIGWGAGLRWRSPVGPLKVDLARAEQTGRWRLHFSVGIAL